MKPFVYKKLYLSIAVAFLLLTALSGYLAYERYEQSLATRFTESFKPQMHNMHALEYTLHSSKRLLKQGGDIISQHFKRDEEADKTQGYELSARDKIKQVYQVDLLQPSRIMGISQGEISREVVQLLQHYEVIEPVLESLLHNEFIDGVAFVNKGANNLYTYSRVGRFENPGDLFGWMHRNAELLDASLAHQDMIFVPPMLEPVKQQTLNFILFPVSRHGANQQYILVNLATSLLSDAGTRDQSIPFVSWHQKSGLTIESNLEPLSATTDEAGQFLATRYLPEPYHYYIRHAKSSGSFDMQVELTDKPLLKGQAEEEWLVYFQTLFPSPYRFLYFQHAEPILEQARLEAIRHVLPIFVAGFLVLLAVFGLLIWQLALPTSKLIEHIEQQNALYEMDSKLLVPGWEKWFEKVSQSFSDNRKLLRSLLEKNKQLDQKVQIRTKELQTQTLSKDRNIALNRAIMNSIPDMIYFKNIDGGYLGCNSAFEYFADMRETELVTQLSEDVFEKKDAEELTKFDFQALKSKRAFTGRSWHTFPDGRDVLVNWLVAPIINKEGEVLGLLGLGRDVTEQEEGLRKLELARQEAVKANEAKSEFIANMSHEIRTPMNAIMGMLELMQSAKPSALQQSYLTVAESSSRHLLNIINDILDFSKVNANKLELHQDVFGISDIFDISFANSLPAAMRKGLLLDLDMPLDFPEYFIGDQVRLNQVFTNLIGNAVKFTQSGHVKLVARILERNERNYKVEFELTDTGVGIPEHKQKDVFEAFTQADTSVTREFGGTGLGLAIVHQLVTLMGGKTRLESEVGQGTQFALTLELEAVNEQPDYRAVKRNWLIYEPKEEYRQLLIEKLQVAAQTFTVFDVERDEFPQLAKDDILICQPDLLTLLPNSEIQKIAKGYAHLQPVVFTLSQFMTDFIQSLPYYPILTMPFSVHALLFNQFQHQVLDTSAETESGARLDGTKILVIEDNDINQQVIRLMLMEEDASVETAENGEVGLKMLSKGEFDAVILDIQMPVMDGLTCARQIRALPQHTRLPIIAMTAHSGERDKYKSIEAGVDAHLTKPVDKQKLIQVLRHYLPQGTAEKTESENKPVSEPLEPELQALDNILDIAFLKQQFGDKLDNIRLLLLKFYQAKQGEIETLFQQAQAMPPEELLARLHNLKGMLGNLGAKHLHLLTVQFESSVKQGVFPNQVFDIWRQELTNMLDLIKRLDKSEVK